MTSPKAHEVLSEPVRRKLAELGIPESRHNFDGLIALFPPEFKMDGARLETPVLAEVLIHLVRRNIVQLSASSSAARCLPGDHVCCFYRDRAELLELTCAYLKEGLEKHEACLWILPDWLTPEGAADRLRAEAPDLDARLECAQLRILGRREFYSGADGTLRAEVLPRELADRARVAAAKGYAALRVAGETGWLRGEDERRRFAAYERGAHETARRIKLIGLCAYPAEWRSASEFAEIMSAHHRTVVRRDGRWRVLSHVPRLPVDEVLTAFAGGGR